MSKHQWIQHSSQGTAGTVPRQHQLPMYSSECSMHPASWAPLRAVLEFSPTDPAPLRLQVGEAADP